MTVLKFSDYKAYLKFKIEEHRNERGYQGQIAGAMGCQRPFLSQVLNSHVHITPDHAAGLAQYWQLDEVEAEYFMHLVQLARAASPVLKRMTNKRLKELRSKLQNPTENIRWPQVQSQVTGELYYSNWYWSAIHVMVSIPQFNTPATISERLRIPKGVVSVVLNKLEEMKLIKRTRTGWSVQEPLLHLPSESPMTGANHSNWRQRALDNIQRQEADSVHYSAVFALGKEDYERLKEMAVEFVKSVHKFVEPSPSEEVVAFTIDLFKP